MEINIIKEENGRVHGEIITSNGKKTVVMPNFTKQNQEKAFSKVAEKCKGSAKTLGLKRVNINI